MSHTWRTTTFAAATIGTASSIPQSPMREPPTNRDSIAVTGCRRIAPLFSQGLRIRVSSSCTRTSTTEHASASFQPPGMFRTWPLPLPAVNATNNTGTAAIRVPMSGTRANRPVSAPRSAK